MTAADTATFDDHVLTIVDEFLQTVVVVDDRALGQPEAETESTEDGSEKAPRAGTGRAVGTLAAPQHGAEHDLNSKAVTDAFAEVGLVCSLLSPGPDEDVGEKFLRAAKRADLVVLDWVLHRDIGNKTLQLVKRILESDDAPERRRLRTIAIYTGQKELHEIADSLAETVDQAYDDCKLERSEDGLAMTKGPVRAAVFAKEHVSELPGDLEGRRVSFDGLPQRLRVEFATLTRGLVTGVALAALGALRDDTHRILKILGPRLDAAYLGHRAALPVPDDATGQAVLLVAAEIRSVIEDNRVGRNVELPVLKLWLAEAAHQGLRFGELIDENKHLSLVKVEAILTHGLGTEEGAEIVRDGTLSKAYVNRVRDQATEVFAGTAEEAGHSSGDFAHRSMMRTIYSEPARTLQLGTIVRVDESYRLCVQPLCDSVRLDGPRSFPFLPLEAVDASGRPDFVVAEEDRAGWAYLRLSGSPSDLVMVSFDPAQNKAVVATATDANYEFLDVDGLAHAWVAELKPDHSQRAAFDLGQQFGRIAVDEAEFLRLARKR